MKKALQVVEGSTLIISEYIEGSSFNKYIELYNPTAETLDLSEYTLELYSNGATQVSQSCTLEGMLNSGSVIVIGNSAGTIFEEDLTNNSVINFNGDDVIVLRHNGTIIDSIGQIGQSTDYVKDMTIVRKLGITSGDTDPFDAYDLSEWDQYPIDTATYLGSHTS
jgi:predicted extracellular nuclease